MNKILVCIPMVENIRHELFMTFYPAITLMQNEGEIELQTTKWSNTVNARNDFAQALLDGDYTHLFFMDSDMEFPPYTLSRLLAHDKDIVAGFYCRKIAPYASVIFKGQGDDWSTWNPKEGDFLEEVESIGTGCALIKRQVFEKMEWPWFSYEPDPNGKHRYMSEDVVFCMRAKEAGFKIYCDATILCGHVGNCSIRPKLVDNELKVSIIPL